MDGGISRLRTPRPRRRACARSACRSTARSGRSRPTPSEDGVAAARLNGWLTPTGIWSGRRRRPLADTGITPKPAIDVSAYETRAPSPPPGRHEDSLQPDPPQGPEARRQRAGVHLGLWLLRHRGLHAVFLGPRARAGRCRLVVGYAYVRGGGEYGREWHKAGQLAEQAQHLARPDRGVRGRCAPQGHLAGSTSRSAGARPAASRSAAR